MKPLYDEQTISSVVRLLLSVPVFRVPSVTEAGPFEVLLQQSISASKSGKRIGRGFHAFTFGYYKYKSTKTGPGMPGILVFTPSGQFSRTPPSPQKKTTKTQHGQLANRKIGKAT